MVTLVGVISFVKENPPQRSIEAAVFSGGSGTSSDPYLISSRDDLIALSDAVGSTNKGDNLSGKYFKLTQDIDCGGQALQVIGRATSYHTGVSDSSTNGMSFNGKFDGNYHTISNFTLTGKYNYYTLVLDSIHYDSNYVGLFGMLGAGAEVYNLRINNFSYKAELASSVFSAFRDSYTIGSIAGFVSNGAKIYSCIVENATITYSGNSNYGKVEALAVAGAGSGVVSNCYVNNFNTPKASTDHSIQVSNCVIKGNSDTYKPNEMSAVGGPENGSIWYFGGSTYNDGCPYLRQFIPGWYDYPVWFEGKGTITIEGTEYSSSDNPTIYIPNDLKDENGVYRIPQIENIYKQKIELLGLIISANPAEGYEFSYWTNADVYTQIYMVYFTRLTSKITFENAVDLNNSTSIVPTIIRNGQSQTSREWSMHQQNELKATETDTKLVYEFTDTTYKSIVVTYTLPVGYEFEDYQVTTKVSEETMIIQPTIKIKTFTITFKADAGVKLFAGKYTKDPGTTGVDSLTYDFKYGAQLAFSLNSDKTLITFTKFQNASEFEGVTFVIKEGYSFDFANIDNETIPDKPLTDTAICILGDNAIISISTKTNVNVEFMQVEHSTMKVDGQQQTSAYNIEVLNGTEVTTMYNKNNPKVLTYTINEHTITYTADTYYAVTGYTNLTSVLNDCIISPIIEFYACTITMTKTDNLNVATMSVTGDNHETVNDGIFVVEYGTIVEFEAKPLGTGLFEYTYTFKYNNDEVVTIKYTTTNNEYAMSSEISGGNRKWHTQLGNDNKTYDDIKNETYGTAKTISPEFEKKFYDGNLA